MRAVLQSRDFRHLTVVLEPASIFGQGGPVMIHGVMIHDVARRSSAQAIAEKMGDPMPEAACDRGIAMLRESCAVGVRAAAALAL